MRYLLWGLACWMLWGLTGCYIPASQNAATPFRQSTLLMATPRTGQYYHGVYPGGTNGEEDDITLSGQTLYESLVGAQTAWVYFSNNWYTSRQFPLATASWIRAHGAVPYIRLMLRDSADVDFQYTVFTLQAINAGVFDADLRAWADSARAFGSPLIVEYGTECNGSWFGWNGNWVKDHAAGVAAFAAAYRHIVQLTRKEGAKNITWVFHVNTDDDPDVSWNHFENYYPGDDIIDWVGVSCYGAQTPLDTPPIPRLRDMLDASYPRLQAMAPTKPVFLLEFGNTANNPYMQPETWANDALTDIFANRWPNLAGFSWWNERFSNDDNPAHDTIMRMQDLPKLAQAFQQQLSAHNAQLLTRPQFTPNLPSRKAGHALSTAAIRNPYAGRPCPTPNACRRRGR